MNNKPNSIEKNLEINFVKMQLQIFTIDERCQKLLNNIMIILPPTKAT